METRTIKIWVLAALALAVSGIGNFIRAAESSPTPLTTNVAKAATAVVDKTKNTAKAVTKDAKKSVETTFKKIRDFHLIATKNSAGHKTYITLGDAVCALLFIILGYLVSRFLGARLEHISVHRFHAASANAKTVRKCFVLLLFVIITLQVLNAYSISLTVFAFLGGALAVGLGFGAQNIMSNFISGIILMFEKPMRAGDVVEISGVSGTVKQIGVRASLIQRGDGVDVLIPNRIFLENVLVNQTHSNRPMRHSFDVGVPYGTPVEKVRTLLLKIIDDHASVLKKPTPQVILSAFSPTALVFTLNYWIELGTGINSAVVAGDLRAAVESTLGENQIELKGA